LPALPEMVGHFIFPELISNIAGIQEIFLVKKFFEYFLFIPKMQLYLNMKNQDTNK